jgi:hypothetical protein
MKNKKNKVGQAGDAFPSNLECAQAFKNKLKKTELEHHSAVTDFLFVAWGLLANAEQFCEMDVINMTRGKDLDLNVVQKLFKIWTDLLIKLNRVEVIPPLVADYVIYRIKGL